MSNYNDTLVAPQEIRDLLARLTEYRVESVPIDEPRTLAGLAANTGIPVSRLEAALREVRGEKRRVRPEPVIAGVLGGALILALVASQLRSQPAVAAPIYAPPTIVSTTLTTGQQGLVPLTNVTYGPDSGSYQVDPTFEPSVPPPSGIGYYASVDNILWGAGDRLKVARHSSLTDSEMHDLRAGLTELLAKAREDATRRKMPLSSGGYAEPTLSFNGEGFSTQLRIDSYNGSEGVSLRLPPTGSNEKDAQRVIKRAVDKIARNLQASLTWQSKVSGVKGPS